VRWIDFYYDFRSPYAYFATTRLGLLTGAGASIRWRPVFIDVLLNLQQGRKPWDAWHDILSPPKRAHFMADIFRLIEYWEVPFRMPSPARPNANAAMSIAALLDRDGVDHGVFRGAVFDAIWREQRDVSEPEELRGCLSAGGHDHRLLEQGATEGRSLLTQSTIDAYSRGVFGVPTFVCGEGLYFGADRMELLASRL
jgi:2-hydroxychromene-2-carboxylate isomerase